MSLRGEESMGVLINGERCGANSRIQESRACQTGRHSQWERRRRGSRFGSEVRRVGIKDKATP
jgi:hypothetical protein